MEFIWGWADGLSAERPGRLTLMGSLISDLTRFLFYAHTRHVIVMHVRRSSWPVGLHVGSDVSECRGHGKSSSPDAACLIDRRDGPAAKSVPWLIRWQPAGLARRPQTSRWLARRAPVDHGISRARRGDGNTGRDMRPTGRYASQMRVCRSTTVVVHQIANSNHLARHVTATLFTMVTSTCFSPTKLLSEI